MARLAWMTQCSVLYDVSNRITAFRNPGTCVGSNSRIKHQLLNPSRKRGLFNRVDHAEAKAKEKEKENAKERKTEEANK